jgi:dihydrofolate reductase
MEYLLLVHKDFEADTFFPEINFNEWEEVNRENCYDEINDFHYSNIDLVRKED